MHRSPQANPLTKRRLDAAVPREKDYFLWCSRTRGFGCRVYPSSKRMFVVQVRFGHEQQRHKIGPYGPFTVEQARLRAEQVIRDIADGKNPRQLKITERQAITVSNCLIAILRPLVRH
jgi:hypothetical protein